MKFLIIAACLLCAGYLVANDAQLRDQLLLLTTTELEFSADGIRASPLKLGQHLSDPKAYIGLQPLLKALLDPTQASEAMPESLLHAAPAPAWWTPPQLCLPLLRYTGVEKFELPGYVHLNFINVTSCLTPEHEDGRAIYTAVHSPGAVSIRARLLIEPDDQVAGYSKVRHRLSITMPIWIRWFVVYMATDAQTTLLQRLKQRFEQLK